MSSAAGLLGFERNVGGPAARAGYPGGQEGADCPRPVRAMAARHQGATKHGTGPGSKKGKKSARVGKKEIYVIKIRSMRRHLKILKERKDITNEQFWTLYKKVNGAQVRSLSHLRELVRSIRTH